MDQQTQKLSTTNLAIYAGVLIVGILIGVGGSFIYFAQTGATSNKAELVAKNNPPSINLPAVIHTIPGTVTALNSKQLSLHTQISPQIAGKILANHTVLLNKSTTVVKLIPQDPKIYRAKMSKFLAERKAAGASATNNPFVQPPLPFATTTASVSDISVGSRIMVTSTQNIKTLKEITATNIQIYPPRPPQKSAPKRQ